MHPTLRLDFILQRFGLTIEGEDGPLFRWLTDAIWSSDYWTWFHENVWNDGKLNQVFFNIEESQGKNLKANDTLSMCVSSYGELFVFVNQQYMGNPWSNLPVEKDFYGVIGLENFGSNSTFKIGI